MKNVVFFRENASVERSSAEVVVALAKDAPCLPPFSAILDPTDWTETLK